jgi:hypothetical protein
MMKNGMAMYEISIKNLLNYVCCITVFLSMKFTWSKPHRRYQTGYL